MGGAMIFGTVLGVVLAVAIFIMAPAALSNLIVGEYDTNPIFWNVVDGVVRVAIFIAYIWLINCVYKTLNLLFCMIFWTFSSISFFAILFPKIIHVGNKIWKTYCAACSV